MTYRVLVIGGGTAGLSAAAAARDHGASVTLLDESGSVGERKSLMPYLVSGEVTENDIRPHMSRGFAEGIDFRLAECVTAVDPQNGVLRSTVGNHRFDRLVLSTGSRPSPDGPPGRSKRGVFPMNGLPEYLGLTQALKSLTRVAIQGATPVSLLLTEILTRLGIKTTIFMPSGLKLGWLPDSMAKLLAIRMEENGVRIELGSIDSIAGLNRAEAVISNGHVHPCDGVLLFPRQVPRVPPCTLELGRQGGILVGSDMRTSSDTVFAAGDCAEIKFRSASLSIRLESSARTMGLVAGANAAGGRATARISGATSHTIFGLEICGAGIGVEQARTIGIDPIETTCETSGMDILFGSKKITCTLVVDRSTLIVCGIFLAGWRACSYGDVISLAVSSGVRLEDISYFDSPYSPRSLPYVSPITLTARKAAGVIGESR